MFRIKMKKYDWQHETNAPYFKCRHKEYDSDNDWVEVQGLDAENAAERFADHLWSERDGWEYMPKSETPVIVHDKDKDREFSISTEFDPVFRATEVEAA